MNRAQKQGERIACFDVAKGISITLVALFHTTGGFVSAAITNTPALNFANTLAYSCHVHLFFAITGYFSVKALDRPGFLPSRLTSLYYPYLLWSGISLLAAVAAENRTNNHYSLDTLLTLPVWPILHYWFLLSLMFAIFLLYVFRSPRRLVASAIVSAAASVLLPDWLHDTAYFYPFAVAGALLGLRGTLPTLRPWITGLCFVLLILGISLATSYGISGYDIRIVPFIPLSFAGCYALLGVADVIAASLAGQLLRYLGQNSLVIYLVHVLVASSLRILLYKAVPALNPVAGVAICFTAAIGLSLLAKLATDRLGLSRLAGFAPVLTDRKSAARATLAPTS